MGHFKLLSTSDAAEADEVFEPSKTEYQKCVSDALGAKADAKILSFSEKAPVATEGWPCFVTFIGNILLLVHTCQLNSLVQ